MMAVSQPSSHGGLQKSYNGHSYARSSRSSSPVSGPFPGSIPTSLAKHVSVPFRLRRRSPLQTVLKSRHGLARGKEELEHTGWVEMLKWWHVVVSRRDVIRTQTRSLNDIYEWFAYVIAVTIYCKLLYTTIMNEIVHYKFNTPPC